MSLINFVFEGGEKLFRLPFRKTFEESELVSSGAGKTSSGHTFYKLAATFRH